jgi:hypothetical protein
MKPCHGWSEMLRIALLQDVGELFTVGLEGAGQLAQSRAARRSQSIKGIA